MTQTVNVKGVGAFNFPDGMSQEEMKAAIDRHLAKSLTSTQSIAEPSGIASWLTDKAQQAAAMPGKPEKAQAVIDPDNKADVAREVLRVLEPGRFGHAVASGATFGGIDEAVAGLESAAAWVRGEDSSAAYDKTLADERALLKQYRADNPGAALAGELLGGFAVPGVGFARAAAIPSAIGKIGAMSALGAGYGGASGFLSGEGDDRGRSAAVGAIGGAVATPLLGAGLQLGGMTARALGDATGFHLRDIGQAIGFPIANNAEWRAGNLVLDRIGDNASSSLDDAQRFIQEGFDAGAAPSLMGYNRGLANLTGSAARSGYTTGDDVAKFIASGQAGQGERMLGMIDDVAGMPKSAFGTLADLEASQAANAKPLYQAADPVMIPSQSLGPMLDDPALMLGLKKGVTEELRKLRADAALALNSGDMTTAAGLQAKIADLVDMGAKLGDEWPAEIPTRWLDLARRGLGDMIEAGKRTGSEPVGSLIQAKDALTKIVSDVNPDYGKAIAAWAGPAQMADDVAKAGEMFNSQKVTAEEVAAFVGGLSDSRKQVFKVGVVDYIRSIAVGNDGADKVTRLLGTRRMREKLAQIFTPDEMAQILAFKGAENAATSAARVSIGGSPTGERGAVDALYGTDANKIANVFTPSSWPREILRYLGGKSLPDRVAKEVVKTTTTNSLTDALEQIARLRGIEASRSAALFDPLRNPTSALIGAFNATPSLSGAAGQVAIGQIAPFILRQILGGGQ